MKLFIKIVSLTISFFKVISEKKDKYIYHLESKQFRAIYKYSMDAIFLTTQQGKILAANPAACELFELPQEELKKLNRNDLIDVTDTTYEKYLEELNQNFKARGELRMLKKDGTRFFTEVSSVLFHDKSGRMLSSFIIRDITQKKLIEKELEEKRERLKFAFEGTNDGLWDVDYTTGKVFISPKGCELLEYNASEINDVVKIWEDLVHPDDLEITNEKLQHHIKGKAPMFDVEQRLRTKNGNWKWFRTRGKIVTRDDQGNPLRITGTHTDISLMKRAEEALLQKTQELEKQNNELIIAKNKAQESDRLKTIFLRNISHEIRTPMNAIIGFSDLLPENFDNKSNLECFTAIIRQRSADLLELINEIVELSTLESGQMGVNTEVFELEALYKDIHMYFINHQQRINKTGIKLNYIAECGKEGLMIKTDKTKLRQIFIHLLNNSFKFTDSGSIEFGCTRRADDNCAFFVSDTGIGIPKDKHEIIFERFMQLNSDLIKSYGGTGLGLPLVKGLIELLGGKIVVDSEIGNGSTFYFTIPFEIVENENIKVNKSADGIDWAHHTVLIVEDDLYNAEYLTEAFMDLHINTLVANSAEKAFEILDTHNEVEVVLMDIRLGGMDGITATSLIKQRHPSLKVIAQTAYASVEDKNIAMSAGCDDYITKPIKKEILIEKVSQQLN